MLVPRLGGSFAPSLFGEYAIGVWCAGLKPSWWVFGAMVVFWSTRAATLLVLSHYDEPLGITVALGFCWDALLVLALFLGARALTVARVFFERIAPGAKAT